MPAAVAVLGSGRVGLTLARALVHSGHQVRLLSRGSRRAAEGTLPTAETDWTEAIAASDCLIIAVPDDAIGDVAATLALRGEISAAHVVLHTSGMHGRGVLEALAPSGAALGSLHPLQSFPNGGGDAALLQGIPAIVEGDARAVDVARGLAAQLGFDPVLELSAAGKVRYHAAAVVASNYLVVIADLAERLAREAGAGNASAVLFQPIMRQVLATIAEQGVVAALTGPVRRGDVGTVAKHLSVLQGDDRAAYLTLGREALALARRAGLSAAAAAELEAALSVKLNAGADHEPVPKRV